MALLITALGSPPAHADGIVVTNAGGYVAAIDGITLNGALYNVTFSSTVDNTFSAYAYYSPTIAGVINSIDSDLGSTQVDTSSTGPPISVYGVAAEGGTRS
jgi:hypothetical protein